jgi:hypothetical protein
MERIQPTEEDGYEALQGHLVGRAIACRNKYDIRSDSLSWSTLRQVLQDRDIVRFPVEVCFTDEGLMRGEFAIPSPCGESATDGFRLLMRPCFQQDEEALVTLALYHLPSVNYLDIVTTKEAELFGAAMLGIEVEDYYQRVCRFADRMPDAFRFTKEQEAEAAMVHKHLKGEQPSKMAPPTSEAVVQAQPAAASSSCCGGGSCS